MNKPLGTVDRIQLSIDKFTALASIPHGNEFLREHIKDLPFAMRIAKTALLAVHDRHPDYFTHRVQSRYRKAGYTVLGMGVHSVALADGNSVLKVYRATAGLDENEQNEMKAYWERKQDVLLGHLGQYAVPQTFSIDEHPANSSRSVVIARQPRIHAIRSLHFPSETPEQPHEATFTAECIAMHDSADALPDIIGLDNIFETHEGIRIVDTIPLEASDPTDAGAYQTARQILGIKDAA